MERKGTAAERRKAAYNALIIKRIVVNFQPETKHSSNEFVVVNCF